jgi:4-amino-4-deoxy-L-arabinose transferase-like glycosyltransferase
VTTRRIKLISFSIALLGAIWAWMVHSSNLSYYQKEGGDASVDMILTADDASYVVPAANFYKLGVWKDNSGGVSSYIQRPPMVGMINWVFLHFTDSGNCQKYLSVILHGLALFVFGMMCVQWFGKRTGILLQGLYALIPCFWGYLFYFLTESITPSLLIFLIYGFYRFQQKNSPKWLFFQGLIVGMVLLTRPQLAIFILPFFYFLWIYIKNKFHNRWLTIFLSLLLAFGGFTLWQIRSTRIAGEWKGIHPIYDVTNNSQYRPVHRSFGELFKIWEHRSDRFHIMMGFYYIGYPDSDTRLVLKFLPPKVLEISGKEEINTIFLEYASINYELHRKYSVYGPIEGETERERKLRMRVDSLTHVLRNKMWKENYVTTPLHSIQWMFTKSQLNLLIFQKKYRRQWWMEGLRYFCVGLISLITLLSISQMMNWKNKMFFLLALGTIIYLFYLFFVQKMNEERYLFPLLPLFLLMSFDRINGLIKRIK